jgi:predicted nucleic acid-binding protein
MGPEYLIDTNILIDFQSKRISEKGQAFVAKAIDDNFTISFVSYIEFLGFKDTSKTIEDFVSLADVIEINKSIIDQTISFRKNHKIKLPDAIIAATAMVHNLTLISRNSKDFEKIKGLKTLNPYTL